MWKSEGGPSEVQMKRGDGTVSVPLHGAFSNTVEDADGHNKTSRLYAVTDADGKKILVRPAGTTCEFEPNCPDELAGNVDLDPVLYPRLENQAAREEKAQAIRETNEQAAADAAKPAPADDTADEEAEDSDGGTGDGDNGQPNSPPPSDGI